MKSILILLPSRPMKPSGGFKVAFEYANRLADDYNVSILYPLFIRHRKKNLRPWLGAMRRIAKIGYCNHDWGWVKIDPRIRQKTVFSLSPAAIPDADVYIATAVETAQALHRCPKAAGKTIYFIQAFENWSAPDEDLFESYRFGFRNVVISRWLGDKVAKTGASSVQIPNGFDFNIFRMTNPMTNRDPHTIVMCYNPAPSKGCRYGIEALELAKKEIPDLKATIFSVFAPPAGTPQWIDWARNVPQTSIVEMYNNNAMLLAPSVEEGWGLPVGEAMICGATVVCTDADGFLEMASDGHNALVSPAADARAMADNIVRLCNDPDLRCRLAENAAIDISRFTWNDSLSRFEAEIRNIIG